MDTSKFTANIVREGSGFIAHCPELNIASEGKTAKEAKTNLIEAIELFLEFASPAEINEHLTTS